MNPFISIALVLSAIALITYLVGRPSKKDKEDYKKLDESLEDEFIVDPETGIKLTIDEAESGNWIDHTNEKYQTPKKEIDSLINEDDKTATIATNYLIGNKRYHKIDLTKNHFDILNQTNILSKYDEWSYSNSFEFENGICFLPAPVLNHFAYANDNFCESQFMYWIKIPSIVGHYYLKEKSIIEKTLDLLSKDSTPVLRKYEWVVITESPKMIELIRLLEKFKDSEELEIEVLNDNLFIKTLKLVNIEDVKRIEKIANNIFKTTQSATYL